MFMQGKKHYTEKLFTTFQLSSYVPPDNFYRRLKEQLDLSWLYNATKKYYGREGQQSIDPVVFFKLLLYLMKPMTGIPVRPKAFNCHTKKPTRIRKVIIKSSTAAVQKTVAIVPYEQIVLADVQITKRLKTPQINTCTTRCMNASKQPMQRR